VPVVKLYRRRSSILSASNIIVAAFDPPTLLAFAVLCGINAELHCLKLGAMKGWMLGELFIAYVTLIPAVTVRV